MSRNLQILIAWMGVAAVIAGAYYERLGLPSWFEDFAMLGVIPAVLILVLLLRRYGRLPSDGASRTEESRGKAQPLWDHKPSRVWFAAFILGVFAVTSLLVPADSQIPLRANLLISLFTVVFGVAVVFIVIRWRRH